MMLLTKEQLKQLQCFLKNLSNTQLIWVSGYIWGLINFHTSKQIIRNHLNTKTVPTQLYKYTTNNNNKIQYDHITIISASQTGNARGIAKKLYEELIKLGLKAILFDARDYKFKKISELKLLIFITSTHGSGEPPEEAIPLYQYLFSKKTPILKNTNFAVLSLGDRSYEHFAKAGKDFDKRFEELGGYRLCDRVDVDIDFYNEVEQWKKQIISHFIFNESFDSTINNQNKIQNIGMSSNHIKYSKEYPLTACLSSRQKITSRNSIKDVHHLEIDITGSGINYQPGDALGIWYENDPNLINELLTVLGLTGNELVEIKGELISLTIALKKHYELTQNHPNILKSIATISKNQLLLNILNNPQQLSNFIKTTPLIEMFRNTSILLKPEDLLKILQPMKPRFYSIASAQSEVGEEIHITVSAVRYQVGNYLRSGGASSYLIDRIQENDKLSIFLESNNNFRLPNSPDIPIIMIGAGTGIAPFRAFIQQRVYHRSTGKNWLFFGNLKFTDDFLYQTEWQSYIKMGVLNKIDTAWSRDQKQKIYVQDKLLQNSIELWDWIQSGAYIYVCGDANRMAYDVNEALLLLTSKHGNMNLEKSNDFWNNMRIQHRYQRDIY